MLGLGRVWIVSGYGCNGGRGELDGSQLVEMGIITSYRLGR